MRSGYESRYENFKRQIKEERLCLGTYVYKILQQGFLSDQTLAPMSEEKRQTNKIAFVQSHGLTKVRKTELIKLDPLFFRKPMDPLMTDEFCICCWPRGDGNGPSGS